MLESYKIKYGKANIQYIKLDFDGSILDSEDVLFANLVGKNIAEIHPFFENLLSLFQNSKDEEFHFSCIHLDFDEKSITSDIKLKTFDDGKFPVIAIHDLTSHYTYYQRKAQIRNETVINSQILELQNIYLKEKEAFKNTFISNFNDKLRDPITGILTFTDILGESELNSEQKEYVDIIKSSSNSLKKMINDILDFSKIETGTVDLNLKPFNLIKLLDNIKSSFKIKAKQKGLQLLSNFDSKLPEVVEGDSIALQQMLTNLLDNAIKFTEEGHITFNVSLNQIRAKKASLHFEISDTGIGIEKEHLDSIFNSFTQLSSDKEISGSGLGLPIVKYLLGLSNSQIKVESEVGKGSTFSTNINFRVLSLSMLEKSVSKTKQLTKSDKKYSILLVDDSEITQLSVLKILASKGDFFLDIVANGEDVIGKIQDQEFDLILMDIILNTLKGDEITREIRKLPLGKFKKIPIIAITVKVTKDDIKRYKKAGMNDVIKKPFNEDILMAKINEYIKQV